MKIENETQYQKGLAYIKAEKELCEAFTHKSECGPCRDMIHFAFNGDAQAAIAAYKTSKIELSEKELLVLEYAKMSHEESIRHIQRLKALELIEYYDNKLIFDATDKGRAYLDLRSQKRELKWEVHCVDDVEDSFRGAFDDRNEAIIYKAFKMNNIPKEYTVREVK